MGLPQNLIPPLGPSGALWDLPRGSQRRNESRSTMGKLVGIMGENQPHWKTVKRDYLENF